MQNPDIIGSRNDVHPLQHLTSTTKAKREEKIDVDIRRRLEAMLVWLNSV